jgi:pimeloyl-ACP methyl ester carboxylesterase
VPRLIALSLLTSAGLPWFQDLPVVHFATDAKPSNTRTPAYTFRLTASLQLGRDWRAVLARIAAPTVIVVGAGDELFNANQFLPMLQAVNPRIGLTVVPGKTHLDMIADPPAMTAIVAAWRKLADE